MPYSTRTRELNLNTSCPRHSTATLRCRLPHLEGYGAVEGLPAGAWHHGGLLGLQGASHRCLKHLGLRSKGRGKGRGKGRCKGSSWTCGWLHEGMPGGEGRLGLRSTWEQKVPNTWECGQRKGGG